MKSRIIGGVVAVVLATVGTVLLLSYVASADQRALAGTQTVEVLVVNKVVPAGTPAKALADSVGRQSVPAKVKPKDAVTSLAELGDQVTTVELVAGEQVIKSRFLDPTEINGEGPITIPKGMQEISVQLEPQRIVGGQLQPGDTVGIFMSLKPTVSSEPVTHLALHKVLVTGIQGLAAPTKAEGTASPTAAPVPSGSVIVTLARTGADAEKIVFAQEFGTIWLSKEPSTASETGTRQLTAKDLFK